MAISLSFAQADPSSDLYKELKTADSLLFSIGFNTCNIEIFEQLVSEDFEFYHDQSGITGSKEEFMNGTRNGLCNLDYQPIRKLHEETVEVFPLKKQGQLYGAIHRGVHSFYSLKDGVESGPTSKARFTHIWLIEDDQWKIKRVISFDHQ